MAKKAIFWVILVIAFTMAACDDEIVPDPYTPPPPPQPGDSTSNPIDRVADTNLGTMTSSASGWRQLLNSIDSTGKYINLDLSACTMTGTSFNPDATVETGKKYIVSIVLPAVATSIETGTYSDPTFKNFTNLKSASGTNITTIGDYSFRREILGGYSYSYLQSVNFPKATTIGKYAFAETYLENINFPQVTTIGDSAFYYSWLKNAVFPLVQSIGEDAFQFCSSLQSISFSASAKLGYSADDESYSNPFTDCEKLTFTLTGTGSLSVIENSKALVRNGTILLAYPSASGNVTMNNITSLDGKVFYNCTELTGVSFPQVTSIGSSTFYSCSNIQDVSFPLATSVGSGAFSGCNRLQSASFPLVTTIDSNAFQSCSNLLSLNIPKVTSIASGAFGGTGNTALTITMGSTAPTLSYQVFNYITTAKTVTVKVPAEASGYSPFTETRVTVSGTNTTANWANGFRGGGWNGSTWNPPSYLSDGTYSINQNITVTIEQ